jgi:hypothetical protein
LSSLIATVASHAYYESKSVLSKTQGQPHVLEHNLTSTAMHMARQQIWSGAFNPVTGLSGLNIRQFHSSPRHASTYRHDKAHHERDTLGGRSKQNCSPPAHSRGVARHSKELRCGNSTFITSAGRWSTPQFSSVAPSWQSK